MHPPSLFLLIGWTLSVAATTVFLAFFIPLVADRREKIRIFSGPAGMAVASLVFAVAFDASARQVSIVYSSALLAIVLSFAGRRRLLKEAVLQQKVHGAQEAAKPPLGMLIQLAVSLTVIPALGIWLAV
ncbi:hypothetical protein CTZ27_29070 [Streptomyces griseocarneus]|nr:hypothetical protein CTZ27_29070 [Streptomyces griseocarneus]